MSAKFKLYFFFLMVICAIPLFLHLDTMPLKIWDESRLANNAIEMLENGNWLVPYFDGMPDMWNTKPPLMIWVQVFFMKIWGTNELALRLPSALAGLGTIGLIFFFCKKILQNERLGYVAALVLVTTPGYVAEHVTRTGDYDALLVFWTTLSTFLVFIWTEKETSSTKNKLILLAALSFALVVLTKGIAGLMILPGVFVFLLLENKIKPLLQSKYFYFSVFGFLFLTAGYYFLREQYNYGYLQAVWENELGGRYLSSLEGNGKEFSFYFRKMYEGRFLPWLYFIPFALLIGFYENEKIKKCVKLLFLVSGFYLLVISFSQTNLIWYDAPVYPFLAIIVAVGIEKLWLTITQYFSSKNVNTSIGSIFFLIAVFGQPYFSRLQESYSVNKLWTLPENLRYQEFIHQIDSPNEYTILLPNYNAPVLFYQKTKVDKKITIKQELEFMPEKRNTFGVVPLVFEEAEHVMICESSVRNEFKKHYSYKILNKWKSCELVIVGRKIN